MTFPERYNQETTWHGKATVMEIYHLVACQRVKGWTISQTALVFNCSIGLVSENLKLAEYLHIDPSLINIQSRQDALNKVKRRMSGLLQSNRARL